MSLQETVEKQKRKSKRRHKANGKANGQTTLAFDGDGFEAELQRMIATPPEIVRVDLTPEMAKVLLDRNTSNRPLKLDGNRVKKMAQEISMGHWVWTGQPIIIADDGILLDGQNRCAAVVLANRSITVSLVFGVPRAAFDKIDIGNKRTKSDIFAIRGEENYAALSSAAGHVWRYQNTGMMSRPEIEPEGAELWTFMNEQHPGLREALVRLHFFSEAGWGAPTMFIALNYLSSLKSKTAAEDFYYQIVTGNEIGSRSKNHPINRLRATLQADIKERLLGRGMSALVKAAFTVKSWNVWREGGEIGVLRWRGEQRPDEPFPRIR